MASTLAPTIQSEVYIERPVAPPSTSVGELFAGFLRSNRASPPSVSEINSAADIAFGKAVEAARQIEDPIQRRLLMREAALDLVGTTGAISEDQEMIYRAVTGQALDVSLGVDKTAIENEAYLATAEGQTWINLVNAQATAEGIQLTDAQLQAAAIAQRDEYLAGQQLVALQEQRAKLGLPIEDTPILKSIKADTQIMFSAFSDALKDGVVTEQERLSISTQVRQFASVKYGAYRDANPTINRYLTQMEGLVTDLTNFDETEILLDAVQLELSKTPEADPLVVSVIRESVRKNPAFLIEQGIISLGDYSEALSGLKLEGISLSTTFVNPAEIDRITDEVMAPPPETTITLPDGATPTANGITPEEQHQRDIDMVIRGTLLLNTANLGDKLLGDSELRVSFYNQTMSTLRLIAKQDDTILSKGTRAYVVDQNFFNNIQALASVNPTQGEQLLLAYEDALRSELVRMENQMDSVFGEKARGILDIQNDALEIDLVRAREILEERLAVEGSPQANRGGRDYLYAFDLIQEKIEQAGGLEGYLRLSANEQAVFSNPSQTGLKLTLEQILGVNLRQVARLKPERQKLIDTLDMVGITKEAIGIEARTAEIVGVAQAAISEADTVQGERMVPEMQGTELGKLGSEAAPYTFEDWSDEKTYNWFLNEAPMGTYVRIDNGDGSVNTFVVGSEGGSVVLKDPATGNTVAKLRPRGS